MVTDCNSLKMTHNKKTLISRIGRWWLKIQEFDFEMVHRSTKLMLHADALSRCPIEVAVETTDVSNIQMAIEMKECDWISTLQRQDPGIQEIAAVLEKTINVTTSINKNIENEYELKGNKVYKKTNDGLKFVFPRGLRWKIIQTYHDDIGHFAVDNTVDLIKKVYWFANMKVIVRK